MESRNEKAWILLCFWFRLLPSPQRSVSRPRCLFYVEDKRRGVLPDIWHLWAALSAFLPDHRPTRRLLPGSRLALWNGSSRTMRCEAKEQQVGPFGVHAIIWLADWWMCFFIAFQKQFSLNPANQTTCKERHTLNKQESSIFSVSPTKMDSMWLH